MTEVELSIHHDDQWVQVSSSAALDAESKLVKPRIIIHGGAGNISRTNLPREAYEAYRASLLGVLSTCEALLAEPRATALDVAVHAVTMLEDNPLFNAGKGAVFTREGKNELEASVMVSNGYQKRATSCMMVRRVRNPIKLAKEMLIRGESPNGGGAQGHCQLSGDYIEHLAEEWGLEIVDPSYFFTQKRWDEHIRGLFREQETGIADSIYLDEQATPHPEIDRFGDPHWQGEEYLPQGTVGAVVLDSTGTICVATSTGGLTNKLPGRIGDTPSIGAGFWAEEWERSATETVLSRFSPLPPLAANIARRVQEMRGAESAKTVRHAVAMSGTGNGDSFLRTSAARTAAAMSRFSPEVDLAKAVMAVAGPGGELQKSAGDRWGKTGEGEGGIIGIELVDEKSQVVADFNCGGMFRAWVDEAGKHHFMVFKDEY